MKTIIAGSRSFNDYALLKSICDNHDISIVVSGTASGADRLGERYANESKIRIKRFPADWVFYGKRAGYIRNSEMANYADKAIIFWDGKSKGSKHMIDIAARQGLEVIVVRF